MKLLRGPIPRPTQVDREKILLTLKKAVKAQRRLWKVIHELNIALPIDLDLLEKSLGIERPEGCLILFDPGNSPDDHLEKFLSDFVEQICNENWREEGDFLKYASPDAPDIDILLSSIDKVIKQQAGDVR